MHPLAYLTAISIVGLAAIFPFYLLEFTGGKSFEVTTATVVTIGYVAVFASVLAFIFWNAAIRAIGANKAGPFVHLMPVFSTILAVLFLEETLAWHHAYGAALIFAGILMTTFRTGKDKAL
jgi:drug/metabolite transporter (DMT)-like permease